MRRIAVVLHQINFLLTIAPPCNVLTITPPCKGGWGDFTKVNIKNLFGQAVVISIIIFIALCQELSVQQLPAYAQSKERPENPVISATGASIRVTLTKVQDTPDWVGNPFEVSVAARVEENDSLIGGITVSFSKPVDISPLKADTRIGISKKIYPVGSKVWNQQEKALITSIHQIVELWVNSWPEGQTEELSFLITPREACDLEVYIRATVKDTETGEWVNAPAQGAFDQQGYPCDKYVFNIREFFPQNMDEKKFLSDEEPYRMLYDVDKDGIDDLIIAVEEWLGEHLAIYTSKNGSYIKSWSTFILPGGELGVTPNEIEIEFLDCNKDDQEEMIAKLSSYFPGNAIDYSEERAIYYSSGLQKQKLLDIVLNYDMEGQILNRKVRYLDIDGDGDEDIVVECYKDDSKLSRTEYYLWQDGAYLFDMKNLNSQVQELMYQAKAEENDSFAIEILDKIQKEYYSSDIEPEADPVLQLEARYITALRYISLEKYESAYKSLQSILSAEIRDPQVSMLETKALYEIGKLHEECFHYYDAALYIYSDLLSKNYREEEIRERIESLQQKKKFAVYIPLSSENLSSIEPRLIKVVKEEVFKGLPPVWDVFWAVDSKEILLSAPKLDRIGDESTKIWVLRLSDGSLTVQGEGYTARYLGDTGQIFALTEEDNIIRLKDNTVIINDLPLHFTNIEDYLFSPNGTSVAFTSFYMRRRDGHLSVAQAGENGFEFTDIGDAIENGEIKVEVPEAESGDNVTLLCWRNEYQLIFGVDDDEEELLKFCLYDTKAKVIEAITPSELEPVWYSYLISPDGFKIAYFDYETGRLWIKNIDGSQPSILNYELKPKTYGFRILKWSPDSSKLMFTDEGKIIILTLAVLSHIQAAPDSDP